MRRDKILGLLAVFAMAVAGAIAPIGPVRAQAASLPSQLDLYGGQVKVYTSNRPLARVAVGNGDLIEVTTIEKRQLVVIAGAGQAGTTTLHLWYEDGGQRSVDVSVSPVDTSSTSLLVRDLLALEPDSKARVQDIGDSVVVTGELTALEAERVGVIAKLYPNVVNLSTPDLVAMQPMVLMDVRIMEFKRDALRDLGIDWQDSIDGPAGGAIKDFSSSFFRILPDGSPFEDLPLPARINPMETYFGIATSITSRINLLTQTGNAYELASPQLSARSGGSADFLAGGEIPIPLTSSFGATNVEFKEYGVKLNIEPVVNDNDEISTVIMTEVSKIDPAVSVQGIPGFLTRRTGTELNVRSGETIVISGLVDITGSKGFGGIPGLANIPVLGRLFRSDNFRAGRTDLVVFVTPRIVRPGDPANIDGIQKSERMLEDFKETIGTDIFD
ncbi:pilus assembly protein N-terminal domain-containing protein [Lysobacter sp. SG-8]|uniref:Pilus assembly protein N-terminal domain-containing protein n=1 Tax=Marilutibacter penaei TaxID=2759900 RepID=A0A7W3YF17_9GAMM|nr:pilus assembly protein N-terminal domain-containing protein [Lysobacter penaei]MBB1088712.1 pilus assembly protein N-terminal domain-containing protein [Lysobacter penaei]